MHGASRKARSIGPKGEGKRAVTLRTPSPGLSARRQWGVGGADSASCHSEALSASRPGRGWGGGAGGQREGESQDSHHLSRTVSRVFELFQLIFIITQVGSTIAPPSPFVKNKIYKCSLFKDGDRRHCGVKWPWPEAAVSPTPRPTSPWPGRLGWWRRGLRFLCPGSRTLRKLTARVSATGDWQLDHIPGERDACMQVLGP